MQFEGVNVRDCGWCGVRSVAMVPIWSSRWVRNALTDEMRAWAVYLCPRCGGLTTIELSIVWDPGYPGPEIRAEVDVEEVLVLPRPQDVGDRVDHLPTDVERFYTDARRVMAAGVSDAAAVQLRKTLEASAAHKGVRERTLFDSVQKLIDDGFITKDFAGLLDHVRKIGNIGAHYTDERIDEREIERAMRFTTQVLRNLFEVPGELAQLARESEAPADDNGR